MKFDVRPEVMLRDSNASGAATVFLDHNDMRLSMRATDDALNGGDLNGITFHAKKEGAWEMRYNLGTHKPSFRFNTGCRIHDRDVSMRFTHSQKGKGMTMLEMGTDVGDDNRVTLAYDLTGYDKPDLKRCAVKWRYTHDDLTVEPGYSFGTEALFLDAKYKLDDENKVRAHMDMHNNMALLEWTNSSGVGGSGDMRVSARMCMDDGFNKIPSIRAEKMWTVDW